MAADEKRRFGIDARRLRRWASVALVFGITRLSPTAVRAEIKIVGSDLLGIELTRELLAFATVEAQAIALGFDGSRRGLEELKAGRADIALLVMPPASELLAEFASVPIGYHAVMVAAPSACPLREITLPQLARAFGAEPSPLPERWESLGATGAAWASELVIPVAPKPGGSLLADFFGHVVLGRREWKSVTRRYATADELRLQFADESKVLALAADERELPAEAKVLAVSADARGPACLPTPENLHAGKYPLGLPLRLMFRRGRGGELAAVARFFFSDAAAQCLARANLVPPPAAVRADESARLAMR